MTDIEIAINGLVNEKLIITKNGKVKLYKERLRDIDEEIYRLLSMRTYPNNILN